MNFPSIDLPVSNWRSGIRKTILFSIFIALTVNAAAQNDSIRYDLSLSGLASSGRYSPFWLQSNQYGKISADPFSTNLMAV